MVRYCSGTRAWQMRRVVLLPVPCVAVTYSSDLLVSSTRPSLARMSPCGDAQLSLSRHDEIALLR